ncbi:unnamed protein product [Microthlaspi erraticum]|uniref:Major facilitator superfamily (MFS) profile domain-containing protein n=1 Tax=Microthlaspi erraticum TaxID=1685480 RepID=A0A6D2JYS8_9BRAS|nr:unnamed protein product [Microthlaspi erraticum]
MVFPSSDVPPLGSCLTLPSTAKTCSRRISFRLLDGSQRQHHECIHEVYKIGRAQTLIALCSTVPGYWFTVAFIDIMGRFAIQLMGFFMMTVFMFAIAFPYNHWIKPDNRIGFVVMLRSTCHGISAATGKAGAIVGAFGFLYAAQPQDKTKTDAGYPPGIGVKNSLIMLGVINFIGMLFTFLVPEPKGKSLEELSGETEAEK